MYAYGLERSGVGMGEMSGTRTLVFRGQRLIHEFVSAVQDAPRLYCLTPKKPTTHEEPPKARRVPSSAERSLECSGLNLLNTLAAYNSRVPVRVVHRTQEVPPTHPEVFMEGAGGGRDRFRVRAL